jgi:hypothetical protein
MATLADLRQNLIDQVDWDPAPNSKAIARIDGFIDRACQQIAQEAPFLFHESEVRFRTVAPVEPTLATDTISMKSETTTMPVNPTRNPWAFETDLAIGTTDAVVWKTDRTWDARWIDFMDSDDLVLHRAQIRAVADASAALLPAAWGTGYRVTIDRPIDWETHGTGPFKYRVYSPVYWLHDDIMEWRSGRILGENQITALEVMGQRQAEVLGFLETEDEQTGGTIPRYLYRRFHHQMPGSNTAAVLSLGNDATPGEQWLGPEPPGTFSYVYTLTWGKRDREYQAGGIGQWDTGNPLFDTGHSSVATRYSDNRKSEPVWESAPSPISAEISTTTMTEAADIIGAVKLQLPNIAYEQGFELEGLQGSGTVFQRFGESLGGWHIRIYRRRHAADFVEYHTLGTGFKGVGVSVSNLNALDIQDKYYLLAEVPGDQDTWFDTGEILPDVSRPLRDVHGYQGVRFFPVPDEEYDIAVRVIKRPPRLVSNRDAPLIHAEAQDLIIYKALVYFYEHTKDVQMSERSRGMYTDRLRTLRKTFGDLRPESQVIYKRPARVNRRRGPFWWYRDADVQEFGS